MEIAHREIFQRSRKGRAHEQARDSGRRLDSLRRRPMAERLRNPRQDPFVLRRRFEDAGQAGDCSEPVQFSLGHRISAARFRSRAEPLVFQPSSVHRAGARKTSRCSRPTRRKSAASTTTSWSTAWNSAAARSVSTSPTCRKPFSRNCSPFRRKKPSCVSATCWTRSDTARRRTAASRWASTGSIAILCGTPSIRDVIAFPKTAKGTCLMTDSPQPGFAEATARTLHRSEGAKERIARVRRNAFREVGNPLAQMGQACVVDVSLQLRPGDVPVHGVSTLLDLCADEVVHGCPLKRRRPRRGLSRGGIRRAS